MSWLLWDSIPLSLQRESASFEQSNQVQSSRERPKSSLLRGIKDNSFLSVGGFLFQKTPEPTTKSGWYADEAPKAHILIKAMGLQRGLKTSCEENHEEVLQNVWRIFPYVQQLSKIRVAAYPAKKAEVNQASITLFSPSYEYDYRCVKIKV